MSQVRAAAAVLHYQGRLRSNGQALKSSLSPRRQIKRNSRGRRMLEAPETLLPNLCREGFNQYAAMDGFILDVIARAGD
jgi:hypothetical protein